MEPIQPLVMENLKKLAKQFYSITYRHLEEKDPTSPILMTYHAWAKTINKSVATDIITQPENHTWMTLFLLEYNLLFQLTVLHRFDLIQILWRNGQLPSKERFLLNSMIEELIRSNKPQFLTSHPPATDKLLHPDNLEALLQLMASSRHTLIGDLYYAFNEEYQRMALRSPSESTDILTYMEQRLIIFAREVGHHLPESQDSKAQPLLFAEMLHIEHFSPVENTEPTPNLR